MRNKKVNIFLFVILSLCFESYAQISKDNSRLLGKPLDRSEVNTFTRNELNKILTDGQRTKLLALQGEMQKNRTDFKRENPDYIFNEDDLDLQVY